MKIENGQIKPCSTCLKVREAAKGAIESLTGKSPFKHVTSSAGRFVVDTKTHKVVDVSREDWQKYIGLVVYLAGRVVYDVNAGSRIPMLGSISSIERSEEGTLQ